MVPQHDAVWRSLEVWADAEKIHCESVEDGGVAGAVV